MTYTLRYATTYCSPLRKYCLIVAFCIVVVMQIKNILDNWNYQNITKYTVDERSSQKKPQVQNNQHIHVSSGGRTDDDLPVVMHLNTKVLDNNAICTTATETNYSTPITIPYDFGTNIKYLETYSFVNDTRLLVLKYWEHKLCDGKDDTKLDSRTLDRSVNDNNTMITINVSCQDLYKNSGLGTGNYMMAFYTLRLFAQQIGNIDVSLACTDGIDKKHSLILPWIMGSFPRTYWIDNEEKRKSTRNWFPSFPQEGNSIANPSVDQLCKRPIERYFLIYMYNDIIFELRRMAIALIGIPNDPTHPAKAWAEHNLWSHQNNSDCLVQIKNTRMQIPTPSKETWPLFPNIEIDDVAFHFRCGDIMDKPSRNFGFMKFRSYSKYLYKNYQQFRSIGIITQPFIVTNETRFLDRKSTDRCYQVVLAFQQYLQNQNYTYTTSDKYGTKLTKNVVINIRNDPNEPLPVAIVRLIMAPIQVVVGISSFGAFAGLASFSQHTFVQNTKQSAGHTGWLGSLAPVNVNQLVPSVETINEPMMYSQRCIELWEKDDGDSVIGWLSK